MVHDWFSMTSLCKCLTDQAALVLNLQSGDSFNEGPSCQIKLASLLFFIFHLYSYCTQFKEIWSDGSSVRQWLTWHFFRLKLRVQAWVHLHLSEMLRLMLKLAWHCDAGGQRFLQFQRICLHANWFRGALETNFRLKLWFCPNEGRGGVLTQSQL